MIELTSKQRKTLEKAANPLSASVIVGQNGATENVSRQTDTALKTHEIVKVKFNSFKDDKKELSRKIAEETNSTLVRLVGNTAIFYRKSDKPGESTFDF